MSGCINSVFGPPLDDPQVVAKKAEAACRSIGLEPSSQRWTDCMIEMTAAEKQAAASKIGGASAAR
jgi:hypothetical protein